MRLSQLATGVSSRIMLGFSRHSASAAYSVRRNRQALPRHDHRRAEADPSVKVEDVGIVHADAAAGHEAADRARVVGAVNGILAGAQRQRGGAHGIAPAAARNDIGKVRPVVLDLRGRRPCRAQILAADNGRPRPLLAGAAYSHGIAYRLAIAEDVVEGTFV